MPHYSIALYPSYRLTGSANFCFFRSETEGQITGEDIKLSTPLFLQLLEIAQPSRIIGLSARLRDYLGGLPGKVEVQAVEHGDRVPV